MKPLVVYSNASFPLSHTSKQEEQELEEEEEEE
jgi:hypothetical protein